MGDASMSVEQGIVVEQQPAPVNIFDTRLRTLFANRNYYNGSERTSVLNHVESTLASEDRFTDNWWEGLYKWLDVKDFHKETNQVSEAVFETLPSLPPDAKLPDQFSYWASGALHDPQLKERIVNTLDNPAISSSLRAQIPAQLARHPDIWSLHVILKGYKLFGEPVGIEMRKNIVPLFMAGLAVEEVFSSNRDALAKLYIDAASDTQNKKSSILSRVSQQFSKFRPGHHLPSSTPATSDKKTEESGRRVEAIRDFVRELFPTYEEYYKKVEELSTYIGEPIDYKFSKIVRLTKREDNAIYHRLREYGLEISNQCNNARGVKRDLSILPLDVMEMHLSDVRQLKTVPGFGGLATRIMGGGIDRGILAPYVALGASTNWIYREEVPAISSILNHLNGLDKSGRLDDRIADEVLVGINKDLFSNDQTKAVARRNLRIIMRHQLPQEAHISLISPLLTILDENALKDGLETVVSIQERDKATAILLLEVLPKLFRAFGDKYKVVLDYVKRKRENLRRIGAFKHQDKMSEDLKKIQLIDFGTRQGERLVKLAISLDLISELNEALQLGISDVEIVPDLKTSYDNVQNTLKGISQQLGITNLEEVYKFLPWIITKDETALKVLRGEEVAKIGEARSCNLQASAKFDPEGMKKEIDSYAQAIGIELPEVSLEDLNLESLKQMAIYIVAELSKKKDVSEEVLREVKPNLDRIITSVGKGGSYTFSINPQDMKSQLEALQNVGSCLSPGGSMFRYTKEYLKNPNTSWATIKGTQGVVGRVTMFRGTDENGNPAIARVSKVYAQVPINESEVDRALRNYALETGVGFIERGKLTVPGLEEFYDDFIGTGRGSVVAVER